MNSGEFIAEKRGKRWGRRINWTAAKNKDAVEKMSGGGRCGREQWRIYRGGGGVRHGGGRRRHGGGGTAAGGGEKAGFDRKYLLPY